MSSVTGKKINVKIGCVCVPGVGRSLSLVVAHLLWRHHQMFVDLFTAHLKIAAAIRTTFQVELDECTLIGHIAVLGGRGSLVQLAPQRLVHIVDYHR